MGKVQDVRDIEALRGLVRDRLNEAMTAVYREAAQLGYDSTEARLEAFRLFADRTIDIAMDDHRRSPIRAVERLNKLLRGHGIDCEALAMLPD